jgi:pimeloyl-ACP methyl ester carboxylesterase
MIAAQEELKKSSDTGSWGFQVDLSHRSKYAELRIVAGSGHRMHQEKPEAIAQAIHDVLEEVKQQRQ